MWQQAAIGFLLLCLPIQAEQTENTNCQKLDLKANVSHQSFDVYEVGKVIPDNYTCTWVIKGDGEKGIAVYLYKDENTPPNQCVKVGGKRTICSDDEYPFAEIYADKIEVSYPGKEGSKGVRSFEVSFALGNPSSCGPAELTATESKQSFHVNSESELITNGYQCRWVISAVNKPITVFIENGSRKDQCIAVTNMEDQEDRLCAKTSKIHYNSSTSPVFVYFPGKEYQSPLPDFTISYKSDRANQRAPIFLIIGFLPILLQFENYICQK